LLCLRFWIRFIFAENISYKENRIFILEDLKMEKLFKKSTMTEAHKDNQPQNIRNSKKRLF